MAVLFLTAQEVQFKHPDLLEIKVEEGLWVVDLISFPISIIKYSDKNHVEKIFSPQFQVSWKGSRGPRNLKQMVTLHPWLRSIEQSMNGWDGWLYSAPFPHFLHTMISCPKDSPPHK